MSVFFVFLLAGYLALKLWLSERQIRYVAAHARQVPAQFAATIELDDHQRAASYTIAKQRLAMLQALVAAAVFLALTWGGGLQRLYEALGAVLGRTLWLDLALVSCVVALFGVMDLPFEWWRQFRIEQRFGFNRMSQALFFADALKSLLVGAALGLPLLAAVLYLMGSGGPFWWLGAWVLWAIFSLVLSVAYPWLIAPIFNRFSPLGDEVLLQRIGRLLERTGFRSRGVYTMDGSRRSTHGNAYFTGLGAAKRIVFYDTLMERLRPDEIEAVLAHELGHFRLHHVIKGIASGLAIALVWLALLGWVQGRPGFAAALGVASGTQAPSDGLVLVLFGMVMPLVSFLLAPLRSALSRRHEFAADAFAAQHASADSLIRALCKLYQDNAATLTPDPVHSIFYDSHPPASIRINRLLASAPATASA
ncbi:MAG TPA: M48 family metallopeptidase [Burkholderiaceae bacterium]|nr:M48 family metallopeptidase [Burkholderiaceae bacterium]